MKITIQGSIRAQVDAAVLDVAAKLRRAVDRSGRKVQAEARAQARGAGFRDGGKAVANAWRLRVYPDAGRGQRTWRPAALVWSRMPDAVEAFDSGQPITVKRRRFLAIPTPVNQPNRRAAMRVTPQEMFRLGGFIRPSRNPQVRLWCLRLRTGRTRSGRMRLFAGRYTEILTGHTRGQQQKRLDYADSYSFVPMFFLMKQVTLRKRLDVAGLRARGQSILAAEVRAELGA